MTREEIIKKAETMIENAPKRTRFNQRIAPRLIDEIRLHEQNATSEGLEAPSLEYADVAAESLLIRINQESKQYGY